MPEPEQPSLFAQQPLLGEVMTAICNLLQKHAQPSAWELLHQVEQHVGPKARWYVIDAIRRLVDDFSLTSARRAYLRDLLTSDDFPAALRGQCKPGREIESSIDALLRQSAAYRNSAGFQEMVSFMANFRDYAPFNNMLVRVQNPSCSFYASKSDWEKRFGRHLKDDARPMIILAPMHPVMLVYDLDQTDGPPLPHEIREFARFQGDWEPRRLERTVDNANERDRIRIEFKALSSTNAGFATLAAGQGNSKMRIVVHHELDPPSCYGALCHELAHIYLGHLGSDREGWWPSRGDLNQRAMEIEAEAVAYVVTRRAGLSGASPQYVSRYLDSQTPLQSVSVDLIAKVAGRLEEMATRRLPRRHVRDRSAQPS
jgi:hypothetical protein